MICDQYSDKSFRVLYRKLQDYPGETRDLIKTASIDYEEAEKLPATAFAWPEMRKFAVHDSAHAALSKVYASGENVPSYVTNNIDKALDLYNVQMPELEKVITQLKEFADLGFYNKDFVTANYDDGYKIMAEKKAAMFMAGLGWQQQREALFPGKGTVDKIGFFIMHCQ